MEHPKDVMLRVFKDLAAELDHRDPDWEAILFQIVLACRDAKCEFALRYDPREEGRCPQSYVGTLDEYGPYMPELCFERFGSFVSLDNALRATVDFVIENVHRLRITGE